MTVSMVSRCYETETKPITFDEIWSVTRSGEHGLKGKINQIRNRYEAEKAITGNVEKAKKAISELKLELPGFLPSGTFSKRESGALIEYSGILCADFDSLGDRLPQIRSMLQALPFVRAIATSPSGDGLKVFFNVINDPARHEDSFRSIKENMAGLNVEIDEKCKDPARICFFTYDPDLWLREDGNEIIPPADPLPRGKTADVPPPSMGSREQIAFRLLGELRHDASKGGYFVDCPGAGFHSNKTGEKHTILYLSNVPTLTCQHQSCGHVVESFNKVLRSEIGRAEADFSHNRIRLRDMRNAKNPLNGEQDVETEIDASYFVVSSPMTLQSYVPAPEKQLIGDYHIVKDTGFVFVIGGPPGVGKSLSTISLGVAGAVGSGEWFGMKIHRQFKTMIIQTENGVFRLNRIFNELDCPVLEDYLRVSEPPPFGLLFQRSDFRKLVADEIAKFTPDIVLLDPWNSVARDQEQRTFLDTFDLIRSVLPTKDTPALGISAHTRKPQREERASGRALMHIIAGSHVLASVPRTVFVIQPASDDPEDDQVVWTCCKNNDGELGKRSAWHRKVGLFVPSPDFDWATFDASGDKRVTITEDMVKEVLEDGPMLLVLARDKLREVSGANQATCYRALSAKGRFADHLLHKEKMVSWLT